MLSVFITLTTLGWIQGGICVNFANAYLFCSTCFPSELTKSTLGSLRLDDKNKITWQGCCLKIGDMDQRTDCSNCALTLYTDIKRCRGKRPSGNCEISTTVSVLQVQFQCPLCQDGYVAAEAKTKCPFAAHVNTKLLEGRSRPFHSVKFRDGKSFHRARITGLKYAIRGCRVRVYMPEQITKEIRPLVFVCKRCHLRSRSSGRADGVFLGGAPGRVFFTRKKILAKKSLRKRRHILGNTSSSYTYSAYFSSPHATDISPVLPLTLTPLSPAPQPSIFCPQSAVINNTTIVLATPTSGEQFNGTLVPRSKLTPLPHVVDMLRSRPSTLPARSVQTTPFAVLTLTTVSSSGVAQMRTSTENATFIYNSRLVTEVYSASNSSFAFITTWNCATVIPIESVTSASRDAVPTNDPSPSKTNSHKKMNLVLGLAVGGGTIFGFLLIAVLTVFIRRYRRIRGVRKKAKQISYFNRYDRSAAWEEPFGGSRLSVFTLKNSKFDIDWETPNEGKRQDAKEEEFGGRSL